jgi:DNA polymerase I-like protein with 3'-5' exonuclease and polymerase domains
MPDDFDGLFGFEPQQVKKAKVKRSLDNPILYLDENPNLNVLVAEYFSEMRLKHISALFHQAGASINLVCCFPFIADEKKQVSGLARYFYENTRSDLKEWLKPDAPIVAVGRAVYAATFDTDIQVQGFYDSVFNNTFFYSPFVNNRVYPIDAISKICGFGRPDQKTGEPIYYYDRWETYFAKKQIERAVKAGDCSIARKKPIQYILVDNPNDWLERHTRSVPDNELWTAVDSETGGFDKLSDPIGDVTISFDGWTAYYLAWKNINPWRFYEFLKAHKIIGANLKFDFLFFMFHGVGKDIQIAWDTMIAGHLLNEMRSNSLKAHAFFYTNYGGYDIELEKYKWKYQGLQSYLQIPDSIRIPYACMDAAIAYQVWLAQVRDMKKEPDLWNYYHKYALPMLKVVVKMEYKGFDIDWNKVAEVGGCIQENIKNALSEVRRAFNKPDLNPNKKQELGKFIESLGWPCINRTKSGGYRVSKKEFAEWEKQGHYEVKTLNEYSKWVIVWNTFIGADSNYDEDDVEYDEEGSEVELDDENFEEGFFTSESEKVVHHGATGLWQYRAIDNKVHTTFHAFMTKSHRHRCVAKGTRILANRDYNGDPIGVPIEDIKVGDYVFCYDDNLKPALKRVTWAGKTGHKEVIRLHFIGSHNHRGYLDVTPEHRIRLSDGSYCEAHHILNNTMPKKKRCKKASVLAMRRLGDRIQADTINNHAITSIERRGDTVDVYDLTVEDAHNFIANEICVSNSSNPNLQNIPKRNYEVSQIVRQCYTYPRVVPCKRSEAEEVYVFDWKNGMTLNKMDDFVEIGLTERIKVPAKDLGNCPPREYGYRIEYYRLSNAGDYYILECDGSNLQAKIAASMSHDTNLCQLFLKGGDFHTNNAYQILAKYQLFDRCTVAFQSGNIDVQMEYKDLKVQRKGKETHAYYNELEKGDVLLNGEVVASVSKIGELISYEEYCKNAKKGKCKDLRQIAKMIGLAFIFGAGVNNLAGGTLRMAWNPKKCQEFIKERRLEDLLNQTIQHNKKLTGDNLYYYVVSAFFRAEFFKLYPELEQWILECAKEASVTGYRRSPWGSRRLLPQLTYQGKHSDGGMLKNLSNISVNSPVQDYETVVMATVMSSTDAAFEELGYISYMPGMVHDSAVTVAYKDELDSVLKIELSAFDFNDPATFGIPYGGECNVADFTKGEFWGVGRREVELDEIKDIVPVRKKYRIR